MFLQSLHVLHNFKHLFFFLNPNIDFRTKNLISYVPANLEELLHFFSNMVCLSGLLNTVPRQTISNDMTGENLARS